MRKSSPEVWNDGPPFIEVLADPDAPAVARRHCCYGGGGGDVDTPSPDLPDYSNVISTLSDIGYKGQGYSKDLYDWAKATGVDLASLGKRVSAKAGAAADTQQAASERLIGDWEKTYSPLYHAQAEAAGRLIGDLPGTEERYAGKYAADQAQAIDQALATQKRNMFAQGFAPSAVSAGALDTSVGLQRAAATAGAAETGRMAARGEARDVTKEALGAGQFIPGVSTTEAGLATSNRGQTAAIPATMASTTAGLYSPAQGFYTGSYPFFGKVADVQMKAGDQAIDKYKVDIDKAKFNAEAAAQSNPLTTLLPMAMGVAGSFLGGPGGGAIGSAIGKGISGGFGGGDITRTSSTQTYAARGGAIDTNAPGAVPSEASPSGGEQVDDVHAMLSEGEFVIPKRTVDWLGEKFFQNLIAKTDQQMGNETVAEPQEGPAPQGQAMDMTPPMFRSEGAMT